GPSLGEGLRSRLLRRRFLDRNFLGNRPFGHWLFGGRFLGHRLVGWSFGDGLLGRRFRHGLDNRRFGGDFLDDRLFDLLRRSLLRGRLLLSRRLRLRRLLLRGRLALRLLFGHDLVVLLLPCGLLLVGHQICPAFASRSTRTVRIRAISRFASFSRALFSSAPVADWKRRLNSSWRRSCNAFSSSSSLMSLR